MLQAQYYIQSFQQKKENAGTNEVQALLKLF